MFNQIQDPRIAAAFQGLSRALGGNDPQAIINADLDRRRGGLIDARAVTEGARAGAINAEADISRQELADLQVRAQGIQDLAAAMGLDLSTPAGRQAAAAAAIQAGVDPDVVTGFTTYTDPQFANDDDFSRILLGTGVVNGQRDTPTGFDAQLQSEADIALERALLGQETDIREAEIDAETDILRAEIGAQADRDIAAMRDEDADEAAQISTTEMNRVFNQFVETIQALSGPIEVDPGALQGARALLRDALAANGGNADAAIQEVLRGLPQQEQGVPGTGWFGAGRDQVTVPDVTGLNDIFLGGASVPGPGISAGVPIEEAAAFDRGAPAAPQQDIQPGQRVQLPTGEILMWDGQAWVPSE